MRALGLVFLWSLAGCIDHPDPPAAPAGSEQFPSPDPQNPSGNGSSTQQTPGPATSTDPTQMLQEVVHVRFNNYDGEDFICSGVLINKDTVVTAGHCLDEGQFTNWRVIASLAKDKPEAPASTASPFTTDTDDVSNPDIGFLRLDQAITLPAYAEVTNVAERIEKGEKLQAVAIARTDEANFDAPFKSVPSLNVGSTSGMGYAHGISTQIFSKGGDSGTGLFLIENGKPTHKLIGIARQPDPETKLDHFTVLDATFTDWLSENTGGGQ